MSVLLYVRNGMIAIKLKLNFSFHNPRKAAVLSFFFYCYATFECRRSCLLKSSNFRWKRTILPEQSQLEEKRTGTNKTLFDQMVDFMSR